MEKPLIIIGIDPGTTVGFAMLALDGRLLFADSIRNFPLDELISQAMRIGTPVAVGTDKKQAPELVAKFASLLNARLIAPDEDLRVEEKRELAQGFKLADDHQMDALASAVFSHRKLQPLLRKLDAFIEKQGKQAVAKKLRELTIKNGISIRLALDIIEKPEREEVSIISKAVEDRALSRKDFVRLFEMTSALKKENQLLREHVKRLNAELEEKEKAAIAAEDKIKKEPPDEKAQRLLALKDKSMQAVAKEKEELEAAVREQKFIAGRLREFLEEANSHYVFRKIRNLGAEEAAGIKKGEMLLVDDTNVTNDKAIRSVRGRAQVIAFRGKPNRALQKDFTLISASSLRLKEMEGIAIAPKEDVDILIKKRDILRKVIEYYRHP